MNQRLISLLGLIVFIACGYLCSVNRAKIRWSTVLWGIGLQLVLGFLILKTTVGLTLFQFLGDRVRQFLDFSDAGAKFVFGDGFEEHFLAFKILPTIIFFSAFISLLYHYQILPRVVGVLGWVMMRTMKTSGAESLSCASVCPTKILAAQLRDSAPEVFIVRIITHPNTPTTLGKIW